MAAPTSSPPALFKPFRALGYITDNVPFAVQRRGKETFVTTSVGKNFQVYNCNKLTLSLVGPQLPGDIRCLAAKGDLTFAAVGGDVHEVKRVHRTGVYGGAHDGPVRQLLLLGEHLLSLGGTRLVVWRLGAYSAPERVIELGAGGSFTPTCLTHPDTYLHKVLVGGDVSGGGGSGGGVGPLQLWNYRTGQLLFSFKGWGCGVRCMAPSPALDVVGVGLADGRVVLHNVRYDEQVAAFDNAAGAGLAAEGLLGGGAGTALAAGGSGGAVTALSFRSGAGVPLLAAGGGGGVVTVWNLEERRLHTVIRDAHAGPLLSLHWFAGEPLLMSSAADNSLKHWVFDTGADAAPRLLRFRAGHAAPPTLVRHYGEGGLRLLSAGCDRSFRVFSVHQDQQSRELSQKHLARRAKRLKVAQSDLRLERVVDCDACEVRERDWANVITGHEGDPAAYTWRLAAFSLGDHVLSPPAEELYGQPAAPVTSVALSRCGNFGFVGSASGRIDRYNMQSGLHRGAYYAGPKPADAAAAAGQQQQQAAAGGRRGGGAAPAAAAPPPAHSGAVVGVAADGSNRLLVSVGLDGLMRVWDFRTLQLKSQVSLGGPASRLALHPASGLAAVGLADSSIRLYDVEGPQPRLVRRFRGHADRLTGLALSADSRWCLSAAMDGTLRVWDVPAGQCLQVLRLGAPVTGLSLGPGLDLLATTHVNRRGVYLWSNQALFGAAFAIPHSDAPVPVVRTALPSVLGAATGGGEDLQAGGEEAGSVGRLVQEEDEEDEDGVDSEDEEAEADAARRRAAAAAAAGPAAEAEAAARRRYAGRDPVSGCPLPLAPALVTLSLLPRSQWDSLAHIEVIKARNKPLAPPKKPEAAPFFLPTLPGLSSQPVFDATAGRGADEDEDAEEEREEERRRAGGRGGSAEPDGEAEGEEAGAGPGSRVVKLGGAGGRGGVAAAPASDFVRQLRRAARRAAAAEPGSEAALSAWGPVLGVLRGMSATAIDRELRAIQILEGSSSEAQDVADVAALLDLLAAWLAARRDFEFCQALLSVVLAQQGDVIAARPELAARAAGLKDVVAGGWGRLDGLLQHCRCMVGLFGNLQQ